MGCLYINKMLDEKKHNVTCYKNNLQVNFTQYVFVLRRGQISLSKKKKFIPHTDGEKIEI